jgi:pyrrolysine biosynthesis protein PylD
LTRLVEEDVRKIAGELESYDAGLIRVTGLSLRQIACAAAGITEQDLMERAGRVAVVPVTAGKGLIPSFTDAVKSIVRYLGFTAFVTAKTDVAGIAEGIAREATILFMADDNIFMALNLCTGVVIDNGEATGRGFVAALDAAARGLEGKSALVIGAGAVGTAAIAALKKRGAKVALYEKDEGKAKQNRSDLGITIEMDLHEALGSYRYIIDATPQGGFIEPELLHPGAMIACPGLPPGLDPRACSRLQVDMIHDPLQTGVATMLALAIL